MRVFPSLVMTMAIILYSPTTWMAESSLENEWLGAAKALLDVGTENNPHEFNDTVMEVSSIQVEHNEGLQLRFNNELQTNYTSEQWIALRSSISVSTDGGNNYGPLKAADQFQVTLKDPSDYWNLRTLSITFANPFPDTGVIVKLAGESSLQDVDGNSLAEDYFTPLLRSGMSVKLLSEDYFDAGEAIRFIADREGTVLLTHYLPEGGTLEEHIEMSDRFVEVDENKVGQELTIPTEGIPSGNYVLRAWEGEDIPLGVSVTPHIRKEQVILENIVSGNDKITITDVQAGDRIYIYDDKYKPSQGWIKELYQMEVPKGQTSVVIQQFEFDASGQLVFLLERDGLLLSKSTLHSYQAI